MISRYDSDYSFLFIAVVMMKGELVESFCGRMPLLLPTSRNHSIDLVLFLHTNKTLEQGMGRHFLYVSSPMPVPHRQRGCPKKTWLECVKDDMESLGLSQKDA